MADFTPHDTPAREASALPVMVPGKLVGRDAYLARVYTQLKVNKAVLVHGAAGMGKTALAATLASAYTQQPGGVVWLNVENSPLEELIVRVGRAYQLTDVTSSDQPLAMIGTVASTLTTHKPLLVLDGKFESFVAADFINKCAEGIPVIVVSEEQLPGIENQVELGKLEAPHATALYKQISGQEGEDAAIGELVAALDFTPFAIAVVAGAARASKQPPSLYNKALAQIPAGDPPTKALRIAFTSLNKALQGLVLMIGATFGGQASAELLSLLSNAPLDTVQQVMNILTAQNLVERTQRYGVPYYRMHALTYAYAQQVLQTSNQLQTLQTKVRDTLLAYAKKYATADSAAHNKLATEIDAMLAAAKWSADNGEREMANELVVALTQAGNFVKARGYVYELLRLRRLATGMTTAFPAYEEAAPPRVVPSAVPPEDMFEEDEEEIEEEEFDDFVEEDEIDEELVEDTGADEVVEEALDLSTADIPRLRAALTQARQSGDKDRQIVVLKAIGKAQVDQKMENEAIPTYSEALRLYEEMDDDPGILEMLDSLSVLMTKTENSQAAVLHASRGVKLAEELGEEDTRMHMLLTLGDARQQLGESAEAIRSYEQALEIARNMDDAQDEALALYKLGYAQLDNGQSEDAIATWEQALKLFRDQKRRDYEGRVLGGLGTANGELERWSEAINYHTSALHIAREVKDKEEEALQLNNLGYASVKAGQLGQAVLRYRQALHLAYQSGDRENIVTTIVDLARLLSQSAKHLRIAELLIDDALRLEPTARDVRALKDRIAADIAGKDVNSLAHISGTAQDYAENAYRLLEA